MEGGVESMNSKKQQIDPQIKGRNRPTSYQRPNKIISWHKSKKKTQYRTKLMEIVPMNFNSPASSLRYNLNALSLCGIFTSSRPHLSSLPSAHNLQDISQLLHIIT